MSHYTRQQAYDQTVIWKKRVRSKTAALICKVQSFHSRQIKQTVICKRRKLNYEARKLTSALVIKLLLSQQQTRDVSVFMRNYEMHVESY